MKMLIANIILAVVWALLLENFNSVNLAVGMVVGFVLLFWMRKAFGPSDYFHKTGQFLSFLAFFSKELVLSQWYVAKAILTPRPTWKPALVRVPLDAETDLEIALLASCITLTPGTLSLELSEDRRVLYVHAMFGGAEGPDALRDSIKKGMEKRLLEVMR